MPVNPFFGEYYGRLREAMASAASEQEARAVAREFGERQKSWASPDVVVEDITVAGPHGPVPARAYRPVHGRVTVALLWAHGGGFMAGDLDMPEAHMVCGELALRAEAFVVSVDYRLANESVHYPVPLDDVHAAWNWLCADGLPDETGRVPTAIGGASSGAALALATALRSQDGGRPADALLLAYPHAHFPVPALEEPTAAELSTQDAMARFTPGLLEYLVRNYVGRISDLPADALPGAARLDGLPPTHIVLSEYDDLRPSGELLKRQLDEAGVPVATFLAEGMLHGHLNFTADLPQIEESLDFFAAALGEAKTLPSRR
ncbi:alpha/beta hydrolase fold domain-containing protein [Streptomyces sp. NBC_01314]|uniref:alpha/beta hydrolase fold domain-containing protein n=1 Tax=Streptomyces sp. NBC_01314 TaxID=2903821 RepID=UPI00308B368E|nr:alpha/beta hydrolase [Streptomyces sp. NBC_01314]